MTKTNETKPLTKAEAEAGIEACEARAREALARGDMTTWMHEQHARMFHVAALTHAEERAVEEEAAERTRKRAELRPEAEEAIRAAHLPNALELEMKRVDAAIAELAVAAKNITATVRTMPALSERAQRLAKEAALPFQPEAYGEQQIWNLLRPRIMTAIGSADLTPAEANVMPAVRLATVAALTSWEPLT